MTVTDFSFATHARDFDRQIETSIPGLKAFRADCVMFSRQIVQSETMVVDIGCSTGSLLRAIWNANQSGRSSVSYLGIDMEPDFRGCWRKSRGRNIRFEVCDARSFHYENVSLACSLFTLQFLQERDRLPLLRRVYGGLNEGGALILAEKVLANSAKSQEILRSGYYRLKRRRFSAEQILDKEQGLWGQMHLWTEAQLVSVLCEAGFWPDELQPIWRRMLFVGFLATKAMRRGRRELLR
jgi:tRNA (cmo5U34)-methyltransferase